MKASAPSKSAAAARRGAKRSSAVAMRSRTSPGASLLAARFDFGAGLRGGFDFDLAIGLLSEIWAALSGAALAKQAALGQNGRKWPIFTG
jgi:hypothetical protein